MTRLVVEAIGRALAAVTVTEWLGVALALAYLVLAVRQSAWCWSFAALSSGVYLWLFARAGLTMQAALQVFYIAMAAYGWMSWRRGPDARAPERRVVRWSPRSHALAWTAIAMASAVNIALLHNGRANAVGILVPSVDAVVAWGSVLTTWMVARKVLENWLYWIVFDLAAAGLAAEQGLLATAALFLVYTVLAVRGYVQWRRDERAFVPAT